MAELNIQQKNMINQLKQDYPELANYSDEQILSLYNKELNNIQLSEDEQISIMSGNKALENDDMGLKVETTQTAVSKEQEESLKQELNTRINAIESKLEQAKNSNGILGILWGGFKNLTGIGDSSKKAKKQLEADLKALESGNISESFKSVTGLDYTAENVNKFLNNEIQTKSEQALNGYIEGQDMALDTIGDLISGIAAVGIYTAAIAAAPFTGGVSIAIGFGAAAVSGALIKTSVKLIDKATTPLVNITKHSAEALFDENKEYTKDNFIEDLKTIKGYGLKDLGKDLATGGFSGALGPLTGGIGGAVGKTAAKTLGIQAIKQVGKEVAEEAVEKTTKGFVKAMFTNPTGYEYIGGNMVKRGLAFAAEAATDGAIGGAVDNAFRTAYDGGSAEEVWDATKEGLKGGFIMSPVIGGGMKVAGKGAQKIFGKNDVNLVEYRAEDGRTVIRIDENGNEIGDAFARNTDSEQLSITDRLESASSREEFVAIRDEIKAMPGGAKFKDEFLLSKGLTQEDISILKKTGNYESYSIFIHLSAKYMPDDVDSIIQDTRKNICDSMQKNEIPKFSLEHFDEVANTCEKIFKNLDKDDFCNVLIDDILFNSKGYSEQIFTVIKNNPTSFQNLKNPGYAFNDVLINLSETKNETLLNKKLEMFEILTLSDDKNIMRQINEIFEDSENFDYKYNIFSKIKKDRAFNGRSDKLLIKKPETIDFILKTYEQTKNDPNVWDDILDVLLNINDSNLEAEQAVINMSQRLKNEAGIYDKISDYTLADLNNLIIDDIHMSYIKELYEQSGKDFKSLEAYLTNTLKKITNEAQKEIMILNHKYDLNLMHSDISFITESWQISTAKKLIDLDIDRDRIIDILRNDLNKDIDNFINKKIDANEINFIKDLGYQKKERIPYIIEFADSEYLPYIKISPEQQLHFTLN